MGTPINIKDEYNFPTRSGYGKWQVSLDNSHVRKSVCKCGMSIHCVSII